MSQPRHAPGNRSGSTVVLAVVAVLAGLGGTYALRVYSAQPAPTPVVEPPAAPRLTTVPLASRDIPAGTQIVMDDVALFRMTAEEVKKHVKASSFMTNPDQIIGKIVRQPLERGQTFRTQDFFPAGQRPGVSARLQPGLRAITLTLDPIDALDGYAGPGQHVDVLFHYGSSSSSSAGSGNQAQGFQPQHHDFNPSRRRDYYGNTISASGSSHLNELFGDRLAGATITLAQDVEILAMDRQSIPTDAAIQLTAEQPVTVTLAVPPRQAELLHVAMEHGRLSLTLRGTADNTFVELVDPVTIDEIINGKSRVHEMEIYRGKQVTRVQFDGGAVLGRRVFGSDQSGGDHAAALAPPQTHGTWPAPPGLAPAGPAASPTPGSHTTGLPAADRQVADEPPRSQPHRLAPRQTP